MDEVRERVGLSSLKVGINKSKMASKPNMDNKDDVIEQILRERACELAFEGFRFNDLQRWLLLTEAPYTEKYSQEFFRKDPDYDFSKKDPKDAEVTNWSMKLIRKRSFSPKHYWFPLPDADVYLYPEFTQNEGWN